MRAVTTFSQRATTIAVALIATGPAALAFARPDAVPIGAPINPLVRFGNPDPARGWGALVPTSARLLDLRVADPAGGPPWGLRVVSTTRGVGCLQVGRVVDGKLGVLGQDGVAHDDHRFHELPLDAVEFPSCQFEDSAGHVFASIAANGSLVSGRVIAARVWPRAHTQARATRSAARVRRPTSAQSPTDCSARRRAPSPIAAAAGRTRSPSPRRRRRSDRHPQRRRDFRHRREQAPVGGVTTADAATTRLSASPIATGAGAPARCPLTLPRS